MEFKLDPYRRNIPDSTLLNDMVEVSKRLGKESVTQHEYNASGLYSSGTISRRFGSWNAALEKAGLYATGNWFNVSNDSYIEDIKRVAHLLGKQAITMAQYNNSGKYSSSTICARFGSWFAALEAAGLEKTRNLGITDEEYFRNLEKVWRTLGRQPVGSDMRKPLSKYSVDGYADRFGTWRKALEAFVEYVNSETPSSASVTKPDETCVEPQSIQTAEVPRKSRYISWRLRHLVMRRDGFRCCNCGRSPAMEPGVILHLDHNKAWSKDGPTTYDNLQTLCSVCNIGKSDLEPEEQ
jgi:5-methylcytosine-specific restriction endonuclease McrA